MIDDAQEDMPATLTERHISSHIADFHELVLEARHGRHKLIYSHQTDIECLYEYVRQKKHRVLEIPYHLEEADLEHQTWSSTNTMEPIIFDLRSENEKRDIKAGKQTFTLRQESDVWQQRPELMYSEEVKSAFWIPSLQLVANGSQIILITSQKEAMSQDKVVFTFFDSTLPHRELQRILIDKQHYESGQVVKPRRIKSSVGSTIFVCLFTEKEAI